MSREDGFGKMLNCSRNSLFFIVLVFSFKRKCQKINCWFCIRIYETFIAVLCRATDRQFVRSSSLRHPCPVGNAGQRGSRIGDEENVTYTTRPPLSQYTPLSPPPLSLFLSAISYPLEDFCRHVLSKTFPQEYFNNGCLHLSDWLVWLCSTICCFHKYKILINFPLPALAWVMFGQIMWSNTTN